MVINRKKITLCYLCGKSLKGEINVDHLPPRQFYGKEVRKTCNPQLLTIPVHKICNKSYQYDEDYFVNTLAPFGKNSNSGRAVLKDIGSKFRTGDNAGLINTILSEFDDRPSGIILPKNKLIKRFQGDRVHRVAWKIIRGLFFIHEKNVLPENMYSKLEIIAPDERPPDYFFSLNDKPFLGKHPGVFDYKYTQFPEVHNMYLWGMLLWDSLIMLIMFHDLDCKCDACEKRNNKLSA
ncbi:MAG: hypothetical protein NPINA01_26800 [Nitrospinaceae bacterium]|nr:MAG: hypothetical protein NPINA01_26800 [Nitrospinaceae bacterium]